ncbi:hypothetical protein [Brevundimonas sp.]|uniref:hypothetical protein n=1 Tax=Brevundimonas sp. TaxID=1871086 RepID=UPI002AB84E56|nr:hypothetical protein [Brevundimonas sp.]MDZ4362496.1 hypothetical protein [Brevundimonas sp.]
MISLTAPAASPYPALRSLRDPAPSPTSRDETPRVALPSLSEMRDAQKAQKKAMAARKVQAVRERMDALKLMVRIDQKSALKMTAELAKELKSAVTDYVEAGGRNVTDGDMAMIRKQASEARDAAETAADGVPVEPEGAQADAVDAEARRAQQAYAVAAEVARGQDHRADRLEAVESAAVGDRGFFDQVKLALGQLKKAREDIKADWAHTRKPGQKDWEASDQAMAELERAIDFAPTGAPEPLSSGASVKA